MDNKFDFDFDSIIGMLVLVLVIAAGTAAGIWGANRVV